MLERGRLRITLEIEGSGSLVLSAPELALHHANEMLWNQL